MLPHHEAVPDIDTLSLVAYPGAGKGTAVEALRHEFQNRNRPDPIHYEVSGMIGAALKRGEEYALEAKKYKDNGKLVPNEVIVPKVREAVLALDPETFWFVDGFPRHEGQIAPHEEMMQEARRRDMALYLKLSDDAQVAREIATERMIKRGIAAVAKKRKDPKAPDPRKEDLDEDARNTRLDEAEMLLPVIAHFERMGKIIVVDATRSINDVGADVRRQVLGTLVSRPGGGMHDVHGSMQRPHVMNLSAE